MRAIKFNDDGFSYRVRIVYDRDAGLPDELWQGSSLSDALDIAEHMARKYALKVVMIGCRDQAFE
jgi:hypothetical protein